MSRFAFVVGSLSVCALAAGVQACGDTGGEENNDSATGGAAGAASKLEAVQCGSVACEPVALPFGYPPIAACCADAATARCGLDSQSLGELAVTGDPDSQTCVPQHQPGELHAGCADSEPIAVPDSTLTITFAGCCRSDTLRCGYLLNNVLGTIELGLGCVDSTPLLAGAEASACDPAAGGVAGGGGSGGASE